MDARATFLAAATTARNLVAGDVVARRWLEPSALRHMTIGELAAHLARAVTTVDSYVRRAVTERGADRPTEGSGELVDAVGYYLSFADDLGHDVDTELNKAVRRRAGEMAEEGHAELVAMLDEALDRLGDRLETAPPDLTLSVLGQLRIGLDDYLVTRLVELTVHIDDLVSSLDLPQPPVNERAMNIAIATLVDIARRRHGDTAVLRALARRERDTVRPIPVL